MFRLDIREADARPLRGKLKAFQQYTDTAQFQAVMLSQAQEAEAGRT